MDNVKDLLIIDKETGETYGEYSLGEGETLYKGKQRDYTTMLWLEKEEFSKIIRTSIKKLRSSRLSGSDMEVLLFMVDKLNYETGAVLNENREPYSVEDISEDLDMHRVQVYRSIKKLLEKKIICKSKFADENKDNVFFVNPFLFCKGAKVKRYIYFMFKDTEWNFLVEDKKEDLS